MIEPAKRSTTERRDDDSLDLLLQKLRWLRLPEMARLVPSLLEQAGKDNLTDLEIIHRLGDEERASRMKSAVDRRVKERPFPRAQHRRRLRLRLRPRPQEAACSLPRTPRPHVPRQGHQPAVHRHPGTGKTFLARALAYRVCQAARRVVFTTATRMLNDLTGAEILGQLERALRLLPRRLPRIDDFALLAMDPAQANLAFQVISERYEYHRSTCVTTNRLFKDWPKVFPDALNAQIIAERFTERAERFICDGKGYRPTKAST